MINGAETKPIHIINKQYSDSDIKLEVIYNNMVYRKFEHG